MRAIADGAEPVMSRPLNAIIPDVGVRKCVSKLKQVVLPAPLGPISAWIVPRRTRRSTPLTATNPLNSLVSCRVSRIVSSAMPRRRATAAHRLVPLATGDYGRRGGRWQCSLDTARDEFSSAIPPRFALLDERAHAFGRVVAQHVARDRAARRRVRLREPGLD